MVEIFSDRMAARDLASRSSEISETVTSLTSSRYLEKQTVHFCGLVGAPSGELAVFLPRNSGPEGSAGGLAIARLTVQTLARYSRETSSRTGHETGDEEPVSVLPLVQDLANDFMRHGIYAERLRYRSRDSGKPDWKSTIASEVPLLRKSGVAVYPVMRTTRVLDTRDVPLARIQAKIMLEIEARHGWWLGKDFTSACSGLVSIPDPVGPRHVWPNTLKAALTGLFANRPMELAKLLLCYLEEDFSTGEGEFLAGVCDFEWVWEEMLRQVLTGVEPGWNERLPKPAYLDSAGSLQAFVKGMEIDMVVRDGARYMVLDAKYYEASGIGTVPRTGDIVKQLMYENAVRVVLKDCGIEADVSNAFVFPSSTQHPKPYVNAGLSSGQGLDDRFPMIGMIYQDIEKVMRAYVGRFKIDL